MLNPYQIPFLIRYFDGIDLAVSRRLSRRVPPSETTLTQEFCALMDADAQRREKSLLFDADALNAALAKPGDMVDIDFRIEAHQHGPRLEAYVSQADFGLILEYRNTVLPRLDWQAAYLMQAKRLFPDPGGGYSVSSHFSSTSAEQQRRMLDLAEILGAAAIRYWLYTPTPDGYESRSTSAIRALHTYILSRDIFDYALGLALRDALERSGGIGAGLWITDLDMGNTAIDVHRAAFVTAHPFTWFVLQHFSPVSSHARRMPRLNVRQSGAGGLVERAAQIAIGDRGAAQGLIDELGDRARDKEFDPKTMTVLPAHSVTIRMTAGPPDGIELPPARTTRD
jgi:hypothetical protein